MGTIIVVDCEAYGGAPITGQCTEFGAATMKRETYHGLIVPTVPSKENPAVPERVKTMNSDQIDFAEYEAFDGFYKWLGEICGRDRPVFVSDNVAFDWQWINHGFHKHFGKNPFGHSGRRISDYYAGLTGEWGNTQKWKKLRVTKHDHNPVHDALGNVEALARLFAGERP